MQHRIIDAKQAKEELDQDKNIILVDVRTPEQYQAGHIKGAISLPLEEVESKASSVLKDKNAKYFIYCRTGRKSEEVSEYLDAIGYTNVTDMGGIHDWPYEIEGKVLD